MKKTSRIATALLLASGLSLAAAPAVFAEADQRRGVKHSHHMGKMGHHGHHAHKGGLHKGAGFFKGLDLTEAQQDKLFAIKHELEPVKRNHFKEVRKLRAQQQELMQAKSYDSGKMKKLVEQETKLIGEQRLRMAEAHHKMNQVLTDEQRAQLSERQQQRKKKRGQ